MEKIRYMISDAAAMVEVESHVLRYWEEELELTIPRNEMGHRYYTNENIREFQQIKELKEKGYQLKAIRLLLHNKNDADAFMDVPKERAQSAPSILDAEEKMAQFRELMDDIVGRAIQRNNEELSQTIGKEVHEKVIKEMNYLMREQEEAQEERYRKLDAAIRGSFRNKRSILKRRTKTTGPMPIAKEVLE